jgi:hypothetical protein
MESLVLTIAAYRGKHSIRERAVSCESRLLFSEKPVFSLPIVNQFMPQRKKQVRGKQKMENLAPTAHSTEPMLLSVDVDISSESLTRKFGRLQPQPKTVNYEVTRDAGYLHQYYHLREDMFIHVWGMENAGKDAYDDHSDIMVARSGNHCIGGGRLTFTMVKNRTLLPMEKDDFSLADVLPELDLAKESYVEISRMAILPEYQNSVVMLELSRQLLKHSAEKKARYAFTLAPAKFARDYRKAANLIGLEWKILTDIAIPDREEYEGVKMVLSMLDLSPLYSRKSKKKEQAADSYTAA